MEEKHAFIFEQGVWIGEGTITLSMAKEKLPFYTRWTIAPASKEGVISCSQEIEVVGLSEIMHNEFSFFDITNKTFGVKLENHSLGQLTGKGILNPKLIGWEFRLSRLGFEGFEFYEWEKEKERYNFHAEYATNDDFRTIIHGKIWRRIEENKLPFKE